MSRLQGTFTRLREDHAPGLVTYITAGDPDLDRTAGILRALDRAGADVLEIGVPFSDPLADGPVIQRATERALAAGTTLSGVLNLLRSIRSDISAPVVVFSYANPILRLGAELFADRACDAGVDGVLILDLPIEEAGESRTMLAKRGIDTILLLSPTTTDDRLVSPGRAMPWRLARRKWWSESGGSATCRSRSGSASANPITCAKSGNGPMPPLLAARWSR